MGDSKYQCKYCNGLELQQQLYLWICTFYYSIDTNALYPRRRSPQCQLSNPISGLPILLKFCGEHHQLCITGTNVATSTEALQSAANPVQQIIHSIHASGHYSFPESHPQLHS